MKKINKILAANRSEIAIRIFRASEEAGIKTVAIFSKEDRFALHRFKTDESYLVGKDKGPIQAYLDIDSIINIGKKSNVDAIHPGYGFLSENPDFAKACRKNNIEFIGPSEKSLKILGNKIEAKKIAKRLNIKTIPSIDCKKINKNKLKSEIKMIGYPVLIKANWGGGGRGMRIINKDKELFNEIEIAKSEAKKAFGKSEIFIEKFLKNIAHVEVQVIADKFGNAIHLFERDCSLQRRHQKILERAPANYLTNKQRQVLCKNAIRIIKEVNYFGAGTVEFLFDKKTKDFYFIEVNPRIQVEHTVTEQITGIDIVRAQFRIAEGHKIGAHIDLPSQEKIKINGHAIQCRITTEDPTNNFVPDYGKIIAYRSAAGFGIRLDAGTAAVGSVVTPYYDSLLVKVTSWANNLEECRNRMDRALREFRIRGVKTNLVFLESLIKNKNFIDFNYSTNFVDIEKSLHQYLQKKDRASKLIKYIGDVIVNGNNEVMNRTAPKRLIEATIPSINQKIKINDYVSVLKKEGPINFSKKIQSQKELLITDTTMRDAHQSLLATRLRTDDMVNIAEYYSKNLSQLFSIECWGGATFDVSLRFLREDPWQRLADIKSKAPNILTQMLFRGLNAVGYKNYPNNVVKFFIKVASEAGVDIFRIFDALNLTSNMQLAIEEVGKLGKISEGAICYTNDLTNPNEKKYTLKYYINIAKKLEKLGVNIIAIKDMAGLCKPDAISILVRELKNNTDLPIHFHTHDTSGTSAASVLSAARAGVDIVDLAIDSMSGQTSQPAMGSIVNSLNTSKCKTKVHLSSIKKASLYWEEVRNNYEAFESNFKGGSSDVYFHQMPGGQFTNLKEQALALGIGIHKWGLVSKTYAEVNELFGDIIKVTPTSKVVGDMALFMISNNLTKEDVLNPKKGISFPKSVVEFFRGELGVPYGGFPPRLRKKILKDQKKITAVKKIKLINTDLKKEKKQLSKHLNRIASEQDFASYLMYPNVFLDFEKFQVKYGNLSILPTPLFYYGPNIEQEYNLNIERGKSLILRYLAKSQISNNGKCSVFFELNGQPRTIEVLDKKSKNIVNKRKKADSSKSNEVGSPLPGQISQIFIKSNDKIIKGDKLLVIEAMKMETVIYAEKSGLIKDVKVKAGDNVELKDLLTIIE